MLYENNNNNPFTVLKPAAAMMVDMDPVILSMTYVVLVHV